MIVGELHKVFSVNSGMKAVNSKAWDPSTLGIVFMAFLCAVLPLDISQLAFAVVGAVFYAVLQKSAATTPKKPQRISVVVEGPQRCSKNKVCNSYSNLSLAAPRRNLALSQMPAKKQLRQQEQLSTSAQPVLAPTFSSQTWDGEVTELLDQIAPSAEGEKTVQKIVQLMQNTLKACIPEIEICGFASGNIVNGKAFGVAVPELDIVARVNEQALAARLGRHDKNGQASDATKLQKTAVRTFTDKLVAAGFKFRRSRFQGQEPKVTLLVPASLGLSGDSIPLDFLVNAATPVYNAALSAECANIDCRSKELMLLVKRWAKDRGICHSAKGHLSPYLWGLLSIYFLQVSENAALPPLHEFAMSTTLFGEVKKPADPRWERAEAAPSAPKKSTGELFKQFMDFYATKFEWSKEAVAIRQGRRAAPGPGFPLNTIVSEKTCNSVVGPSIEDPFNPKSNLADEMNGMSFDRLKEELARAHQLCCSGASLSELLEPWAPTEEPAPEVHQAKTTVATSSTPPWRRHTP